MIPNYFIYHTLAITSNAIYDLIVSGLRNVFTNAFSVNLDDNKSIFNYNSCSLT